MPLQCAAAVVTQAPSFLRLQALTATAVLRNALAHDEIQKGFRDPFVKWSCLSVLLPSTAPWPLWRDRAMVP